MEDVVSPPAPGVGKVAERMHGSTIGQKALMALTGTLLVGFVFAHMAGHLQMFQGPEAYNRYAHMLQSLGGIKWAVRLGLLALAVIHVVSAVQVTRRNRAARPIAYAANKWLAAGLGSRTMRLSGVVLFFFILWHLMHFTVLSAATNGFLGAPYLLDGAPVPDVYGRMVHAFQRPGITGIYLGCMVLLCLHLAHGIQSALQSLGALNSTYRPLVKQLGPLASGLLFVGFATVPLAILAGFIK